MTCVEMLESLIRTLEAAKADAAKVDSGKTGTSGTRLRKTAGAARLELQNLRNQVTALRKPTEA